MIFCYRFFNRLGSGEAVICALVSVDDILQVVGFQILQVGLPVSLNVQLAGDVLCSLTSDVSVDLSPVVGVDLSLLFVQGHHSDVEPVRRIGQGVIERSNALGSEARFSLLGVNEVKQTQAATGGVDSQLPVGGSVVAFVIKDGVVAVFQDLPVNAVLTDEVGDAPQGAFLVQRIFFLSIEGVEPTNQVDDVFLRQLCVDDVAQPLVVGLGSETLLRLPLGGQRSDNSQILYDVAGLKVGGSQVREVGANSLVVSRSGGLGSITCVSRVDVLAHEEASAGTV